VKVSAELVADVPFAVLTVTSTGPSDPEGVTAVNDVAEVMLNELAATDPKSTVVAPVKLVPVMVTEVPPAIGPEEGLTEVTVGVNVA
jgi:hypothetical protein